MPRSTGHACRDLTLVPAPQDLSRKDCLEAPVSGLGELPPASSKLSTSPSAVGTLKRPTSLSRHASAAGFPLTAAGPRAVPKGHKTPTSYSPMDGGEGPFIDTEDISQLLTDVARFADALENLRDVVLRDGECLDCPRLPPAPVLPTQHRTIRHIGTVGHRDERGSIPSVGTDRTHGWGSLPGPGAYRDPRGGLCQTEPRQPRADGGGWLLGAQSQDNAASCLQAIFIRPFSCLQCSGASCLPGPPEPHRALGTAPRPARPASPGWLVGWGRCPSLGPGGLQGHGWVSLPTEAKGTAAISWSPWRGGAAGRGGSHDAVFSVLALQTC